MHGSVIVVLTNVPDAACADRIANALVERQLVACVNILAPCRALYRWQGRVESAEEIPVLMKTVSERYTDVETAIRALHPYEVPEIIAWPITEGHGPYCNWVAETTRAIGSPSAGLTPENA